MDKNTADWIKQAELVKKVQEDHAAVSEHSSTESAVSEPEYIENDLSAVNSSINKKDDHTEKGSEKKKPDVKSDDDKKKKLKQHIQQTVYLQRNSGSAKLSASRKQETSAKKHGIVGSDSTAIMTGVKGAKDAKRIENVKDISDAYDYTKDQAVKLVVNSLKVKIAQSSDQIKARQELKQELSELKSKDLDDATKEYKDLMKISSTGFSTEEMSKLNSLIQKGVPDYIALEQTVKELNLKAVGLYTASKPVKAAISAGKQVAAVVQTANECEDTGDAAASLVLLSAQKVAEVATKGALNAFVKSNDYGEKTVKKATEKVKDTAPETINENANELKDKAKQAAENRKYLTAQQTAKKKKAKEIYKNYQKAKATQNTASVVQTLKAFIAEKGGGATIAAGGGVAITIVLAVIVILVVISVIFSWLTPHSDTLYNDTSKTYETLELKEEKEILEGYIKHIQDWFDKKQIEILKVTDLKYGGFDPDDYKYTERVVPSKARVEYEYGIDITNTKKYKVEARTGQFKYEIEEQTETDTKSIPLFYKVYYKYKEDEGFGLLEYSDSTDYDYCDTIIKQSIDLNAFYQTDEYKELHKKNPSRYPVYTYDNGVFSQGESIYDALVTRTDGVNSTTKPLERLLLDMDDPAIASLYEGGFSKDFTYKGNLVGVVHKADLLEYSFTTSAFEARPKSGSASGYTNNAEGRFDPNIWNLNEMSNKWIKLSDDIDFEGIIALAALKKWQEIEMSGSSLPDDHNFHITDYELDDILSSLYKFEYGYSTGKCRDEDCNRKMTATGWVYYCDRASTHKHLRGVVINYSIAGGIDLILDKVLDTSSPYFEQDKQIYAIYKQYINDKLGSSTKLDDYENNRSAQQRLYRKYLLENGEYLPNAPQNVQVSDYKFDLDRAYCSEENPSLPIGQDYTAHVPVTVSVSWQPPEYAEDTNVLGYNVYVYTYNGYKMLVGTTTETSINVTMTKNPMKAKNAYFGSYWGSNVKEGGFSIGITKLDSGGLEYSARSILSNDIYGGSSKKFILVTAYNEYGESLIDRQELREMQVISETRMLNKFAGLPITKHNIELITYPKVAQNYWHIPVSVGMELTLDNGRKIKVVPNPNDE